MNGWFSPVNGYPRAGDGSDCHWCSNPSFNSARLVGFRPAGVVVAATGSMVADPIVSLGIAAFILFTSFGITRDSATILLEGTPPGTDMPAVISTARAVSGVLDVHDLHVWMVGPGVVACSCHVVVAPQGIREGQQVVCSVARDSVLPWDTALTTRCASVTPPLGRKIVAKLGVSLH